MLTSIIIILVLLFFSAYFSGMEIAYVSSNKVQLEIEKKQGGVIGSILEKLTRKPSKFIATMLVGNNVTLVIYGIEMGKLILSYLPEYFHGIDDYFDLSDCHHRRVPAEGFLSDIFQYTA